MEQGEAYALNALRSKTEPIAIHLTINDRDLEMELDTGASVTIMSERTYRSLWPVDPPPLAPSSMALKTYTGERIQVRGCAQVRDGYKGQRAELPLLVVGGRGPSLLGRNWLMQLRLDWEEICYAQRDLPSLASFFVEAP